MSSESVSRSKENLYKEMFLGFASYSSSSFRHNHKLCGFPFWCFPIIIVCHTALFVNWIWYYMKFMRTFYLTKEERAKQKILYFLIFFILITIINESGNRYQNKFLFQLFALCNFATMLLRLLCFYYIVLKFFVFCFLVYIEQEAGKL